MFLRLLGVNLMKMAMDNQRIGSLNSLVDYVIGESDIEDSDDEVEREDNRDKPIVVARPSVAQARVKTSKFCVRLVSKICQAM